MKLRVSLVKLLFLGLLATPSIAFERPQQQGSTEQGATIAGRVTLRSEPVSGVLVVVQSDQPFENYRTSAKTDADGKYRVTRIPAGSYSVRANGQAFIGADKGQHYGYSITLDRDEIREGLDFSLRRGGVITGRVLAGSGRPVIEEPISVKALSADSYFHPQGLATDDRGVYRIYGLQPGRYKLSVGRGQGSQFPGGLDQGQTYYPQTYHPGVTDEAKAGIIEVTEGGEVAGIDIILGARARTFEASGRLVDAETGKPQAGINWGYAGNGSNFGQKSDAEGRFRITGLMPGRYKVFAGCEGDYFMDPIEFDLTDRDVAGLELKRYRGASISGKVVVEGVNDPAVLGKLSQLSLIASGIASGVGSQLDPDGSYYFCGLRPGRVKISAGSIRSPGLRLLRIERDGADVSDGIDVVPGDHVTGVRIVLAHYTGVIRGTVIVSGPVLPEGLRVGIVARRLGDDSEAHSLYVVTDERGRFVFEGLIPGDYELFAGSNFRGLRPGVQIPRFKDVLVTVSVGNGTESTVTLQLKRIDKDN